MKSNHNHMITETETNPRPHNGVECTVDVAFYEILL